MIVATLILFLTPLQGMQEQTPPTKALVPYSHAPSPQKDHVKSLIAPTETMALIDRIKRARLPLEYHSPMKQTTRYAPEWIIRWAGQITASGKSVESFIAFAQNPCCNQREMIEQLKQAREERRKIAEATTWLAFAETESHYGHPGGEWDRQTELAFKRGSMGTFYLLEINKTISELTEKTCR